VTNGTPAGIIGSAKSGVENPIATMAESTRHWAKTLFVIMGQYYIQNPRKVT
jgi:hypothetical protein